MVGDFKREMLHCLVARFQAHNALAGTLRSPCGVRLVIPQATRVDLGMEVIQSGDFTGADGIQLGNQLFADFLLGDAVEDGWFDFDSFGIHGFGFVV